MFPGYNAHLEEMHATEEDYILGGVSKLPQIVKCPERNWTPWLTRLEVQRNNVFDPFNCTSHSNDNVKEVMEKQQTGIETNDSDRYLANVSGTVPGQGNSHKAVAEARRKMWNVAEEQYPITPEMSETEFYTKPPQELIDSAIKISIGYEYGYEKVELKDLYDSLQFSPDVAAVDSRTARTSEFQSYDHSIMIYGFDPIKNKWLVFDSYFGRAVEYDKDYPFGFIMRFHYQKVQNVVENGIVLRANPRLQCFIKQLIAKKQVR